jgi:ribonuclease/clavin/mitogillin
MILTASLILVRNPPDLEVFWVQRSPQDRFLSHFHVFPGGRVEAEDHELGADLADGAERVGAVRETFEETGFLFGHPELTDPEGRSALRAGSTSFEAVLGGRLLPLHRLVCAGKWTAPAYLVREFTTRFYAAWVDSSANPRVEPGDPELVAGEWIRPRDALAKFERGQVLMAPPTQGILRALIAGAMDEPDRFIGAEEARGAAPTHGRIRPHITLYPLRTPTLPPATHTNCYILGHRELLVVEPASPYPKERAALDAHLAARCAAGARVRGVALTHHHHDHIGGVEHFIHRWGGEVMAHPETVARVPFPVQRVLSEGDRIELDGLNLEVIHTPGHAPGHLVFIEPRTRSAIVGDMVAGVGSILVEPEEGDMGQYINSLRRLTTLRLSVLLPSHGPAIGGVQEKLTEYIEHRLHREAQVVEALSLGPSDLKGLVDRVYLDVHPMMKMGPDGGLAGRSLRAHLDKLVREGRASHDDAGVWRGP